MNDMIIALLANLCHWLGGNLGWGIIVLSLGIRVALLPLTISLARRARGNQDVMQRLQPEIDRLKQRYEKKPERLFKEMRELYRKHDCSPFDIPTLFGSFIQLPIFGMLYSSIRSSLTSSSAFLWIKSLASPDFLLTLVILSLTGVSAWLMPSASDQMRNTLLVVQIVVTFFIVWKLAAGLGLYWASSSLVSVFQTLWLRYRDAPIILSQPHPPPRRR
jgi:YidC/Oxa1 family membrane protein insertase